jgi:hypothetical protein
MRSLFLYLSYPCHKNRIVTFGFFKPVLDKRNVFPAADVCKYAQSLKLIIQKQKSLPNSLYTPDGVLTKNTRQKLQAEE